MTAVGRHLEEPVANGASLSQPSRAEAILLMRGGLAEAMRNIAANYVMPICWITAHDRKPLILDNGSAFLLDCGAGPFLVTANHVYQGFLAAKNEHPDAVCMVGDVRFDLADRHIASDSAYDVATFRVAHDEIGKLANYANGKIILMGSQASWPPAPPAIDHGVFFVGFPGDGREMRPYRGNSLVEIDWVGYTALAVASGVSATDITLVFDHEHDFDVGLRPRIPSDWALGGCSGAPLLTFVEQRGIFSWRLGGIIYESSSLILKASRADCLNPDGTLNRYPDPMAYRGR
ncbi:hypothetical protein AfiDRAFT_0981 [Afipia sp. 1NLS2]|nr:hypothetical protein AfiDRAFT_0981 [Afipia sp. 1NLS2]